MKKLCAAVIVFAAMIVFVAVWFSPLALFGGSVYADNEPVREARGLYAATEVVRVDMEGGENELSDILGTMLARVVKTEQAGGITVVYAVSPRVAAAMQATCDGIEYNVMAAYGNGRVVVGTPVIQGSY